MVSQGQGCPSRGTHQVSDLSEESIQMESLVWQRHRGWADRWEVFLLAQRGDIRG